MTDAQQDRIYQFMLDQHQRRPFQFKAVNPEQCVIIEGIFTTQIGLDLLVLKATDEDKRHLDEMVFIGVDVEAAVDWVADTCDHYLTGDYVTTI
jgi:aromatic ring-cleaving dioxygenase